MLAANLQIVSPPCWEVWFWFTDWRFGRIEQIRCTFKRRYLKPLWFHHLCDLVDLRWARLENCRGFMCVFKKSEWVCVYLCVGLSLLVLWVSAHAFVSVIIPEAATLLITLIVRQDLIDPGLISANVREAYSWLLAVWLEREREEERGGWVGGSDKGGQAKWIEK